MASSSSTHAMKAVLFGRHWAGVLQVTRRRLSPPKTSLTRHPCGLSLVHLKQIPGHTHAWAAYGGDVESLEFVTLLSAPLSSTPTRTSSDKVTVQSGSVGGIHLRAGTSFAVEVAGLSTRKTCMRENLEDHRMDTCRCDPRNEGFQDESLYGQRKGGKGSGKYGYSGVTRGLAHTHTLSVQSRHHFED